MSRRTSKGDRSPGEWRSAHDLVRGARAFEVARQDQRFRHVIRFGFEVAIPSDQFSQTVPVRSTLSDTRDREVRFVRSSLSRKPHFNKRLLDCELQLDKLWASLVDANPDGSRPFQYWKCSGLGEADVKRGERRSSRDNSLADLRDERSVNITEKLHCDVHVLRISPAGAHPALAELVLKIHGSSANRRRSGDGDKRADASHD